MTSWNKSAEKFDYVNQTLEFVGNISSGSQTLLMSKMIQSGLLEMLMPLLEGHNKQISKIVCWIIGNMAAEENEELCQINI